MPVEPDFAAALEKHSIELEPQAAEQLQAYAKAMWRWNEQLNLTRHTTWDLFVSRDLRDCVQLAPLLEAGEEVLDLGSGNGVPGIPLAILRPDVDIALAESVKKRAHVLGEIIGELGLPVTVYAARGEDLLQDFRFSTIVARAVGSVTKFCRWVEPHWASIDRLLLIKGPKWVEERGEARHHGLLNKLQLRRVVTYPLGVVADSEGADSEGADSEGADSEGVILQIWPKSARGKRFT